MNSRLRLPVVVLGAAAFAAVSAAADSTSIVPGRSIGPIKIGMTRTAVYRELGTPGFTNVAGGNRNAVYDDWTITFRGTGTSAPAFIIGSRVTRYRTSNGIRVGSTVSRLRAAYPASRCFTRRGTRFCRLLTSAGKTYFFLKPRSYRVISSILVAHKRVPELLVTSR